MPQITVDYSEPLADSFDRRGFALALHPLLVEEAAATLESCKTRFVRTEATVVGGDQDGHAVVHVLIGLLPGRPDDTKARVTAAVLDLVHRHVKPTEGLAVHLSAEVRDLDASYRKAVQG
ncbi:5-carboxymethyl-2-hydroxymuconate Delta-isomerase [Streptomyces lasiicapitis]|uniref:Isomerase n=1 Tax=Streptomyces lasiicapitis TaxID=1923961 RepID=A0ABQ2LZB7_9ACTN|nr:isomerase [Streptomyces lasiicapitis]GGO45008.1 isomerase [Streptomyces lasiicapitis]